MIFKKPAAVPTPVPQLLSWQEESSEAQNFWVNVCDWQYKVFPSLKAQSFGTWMFQFEGIATSEPLKGLAISGEVEALNPPEPPEWLQDYWATVPDDLEGHCILLEPNDSSRRPSFHATLYCQPSALDWIYRAFAVASQSRSGSLGIEIHIDCPNNPGGNFWRDSWRKEYLRVRSWQLFSGAQLHAPESR